MNLQVICASLSARERRVRAAWVLILFLQATAIGVGVNLPPWGRLGAAWCGLWVGFKLLTLAHLSSERLSQLKTGRVFAYLFLWHGNNPRPFLDSQGVRKSSSFSLALNGGKNILLGILLLERLSGAAWLRPLPLLEGWIGLIGLGLILHLGLADWITAFWQWRGLNVDRLFRFPLGSRSVTEFWGGRWNLAFTQLTRDTIFVPMVRRFGGEVGTAAGFLFSGALHELVVSFPAGGWYGFPTLYYLIQAAAILAERRWVKRWLAGRFLYGWLWTCLVVAGPLPLMFHPPFMLKIVLPLLEWIGVLPGF